MAIQALRRTLRKSYGPPKSSTNKEEIGQIFGFEIRVISRSITKVQKIIKIDSEGNINNF